MPRQGRLHSFMISLFRWGWFGLLALTLLAGCRRPAPTLTSAAKQPVNSLASTTTDWADERRQGTDFVAAGGTQSTAWRLAIDFAKQMRLATVGGPDLLVPVPKPQPSRKGLGVVLDSRSAPMQASASRRATSSARNAVGQKRLLVSIEPVSWRDPLTKRDYAYTVRVEANGKPYVGGGAFLNASHRLNGTWVLETFRGQRMRPAQFGDNALPSLTIDLAKGRLTGSTGWNKLRGDVRASADHLSLDPKPTGRPPASGSLEAGLVEALRQVSLFRIGKERLTLLVNGQYVMTLRKG